MAKGRGQEAEEAADLIVNDEFNIGEMDPANLLDEDWSSDEDPISQSEIESDDHGDFYSGCQVLNRTQGGANVRGWDVRTRGGLVRGIGTTHGLSTGGRTIRSRLERGVVANANAMTFMINSNSNDSSNAEEEDSVNQGSLTSDNSNLPNDNPSSADDENSVNQGSDTIDNSNLADDNSSEGNESNGNLNDNWSIADPALKVLQFVENEGIKIDVPADDNPLFFSNLFLTDQRLNKLVTRLNAYAQKVINSSQPLRWKSVLNTWKDVAVAEMKQFQGLVLYIGPAATPTCKSYWSQNLLYKNELFKSVMTGDRLASIMRFLNLGEELVNKVNRLGKIRFLISRLNTIVSEIFTPHKELSLDESMMLWLERLVFRQCIKNKRHKCGIKFFELLTNDGFLLKTEIYLRQKFSTVPWANWSCD